METKWTPGPWSVGAPSGHNANYVFAGDDSVASVFGLPMHTSLEDIPIGARWENGLANASLIAAAPALYGALACAEDLFAHTVGMMTFSGDGDNQSRNEGEVHRILKEMRAALALARGETSHPEHCGGMETSTESGEPNQEKSS